MKQTDNYTDDFRHFMEQRLKASTDFAEGRFVALKNISAESPRPPFFRLRVFV
ncbi:hypothetical protein U0035_21540 [Niabella yanshanensis]|uniref:Uncharacterized protein n=1 Tax=Niabella yanshanensis TaxID=577386 RepID=A0ABZ0W4S0_9BACT|nr:hypothetical protein [Niabella yanshanensis]WQD38258.1 hypothetical protein U0035_21540 [Niabella yanshanensis]